MNDYHHDLPKIPLNLDYIPRSDIDFISDSFLGSGSFGIVKQATWRDQKVAVKYLTSYDDFIKEAEPLSKVRHENIIPVFGYTIIENNYILIIEYADGGNLYNVMHHSEFQKTHYTLSHAISWCLQCARGIDYLHQMNILHRDLKPLNLLLTNEGRTIKICDFGTARDKQTIMSINRGSPSWMAPEVFTSQNYSEKCDVFSWGIILWEVLAREVPYKEHYNSAAISWAISSKKRPPMIRNCPSRLRNLLTSCWNHEPKDRPSMSEVVEEMSFIFERCSRRANEKIDLVTPREKRTFIGAISNISTNITTRNTNTNNSNNNPLISRRISDDISVERRPTNSSLIASHRRSNSSDASLILATRKDPIEEKIDGLFRNFHAYMLLPSQYSPGTPDITSTQSMLLFEEHRQLSLKLLRLKFETSLLENHIKDLEAKRANPNLLEDPTSLYIRLTNENRDLRMTRTCFAEQLLDISSHPRAVLPGQRHEDGWVVVDRADTSTESPTRTDR